MKNNIAYRLAEQLTEFMKENQTKEFNILYSDIFYLLYSYLTSNDIIDKRLVDNIGSFLIDMRTCIDKE